MFTYAVRDTMNVMWWGVLIGMVAVGLIDRVPRQFVIEVIGRDQGTRSLFGAVMAACCWTCATTAFRWLAQSCTSVARALGRFVPS